VQGDLAVLIDPDTLNGCFDQLVAAALDHHQNTILGLGVRYRTIGKIAVLGDLVDRVAGYFEGVILESSE
jgi:phosphoribosyl 1,2-cyclic phosphodiesterase